MANEVLKRDENHVTVIAGVTNDVAQDITMARQDPVSLRLLVDAIISGGSTGGNIVSTKTPLTASAPTVVSIGTSTTLAVAANADRKGLTLINLSSNLISLAFGSSAVLGSGITLSPRGAYSMSEYDFNLSQVNAIAGGAASNLAIQEYTT